MKNMFIITSRDLDFKSEYSKIDIDIEKEVLTIYINDTTKFTYYYINIEKDMIDNLFLYTVFSCNGNIQIFSDKDLLC